MFNFMMYVFFNTWDICYLKDYLTLINVWIQIDLYVR